MEVKEQITVELSESDISTLVKQYLGDQGYDVYSIQFVTQPWHSQPRQVSFQESLYANHANQVTSTLFKGVKCKVKRK